MHYTWLLLKNNLQKLYQRQTSLIIYYDLALLKLTMEAMLEVWSLLLPRQKEGISSMEIRDGSEMLVTQLIWFAGPMESPVKISSDLSLILKVRELKLKRSKESSHLDLFKIVLFILKMCSYQKTANLQRQKTSYLELERFLSTLELRFLGQQLVLQLEHTITALNIYLKGSNLVRLYLRSRYPKKN